MRPLLSAAVLRSQSDERLVALVRAGHEQAFATIIGRYRRELHAHARRIAPADRSEDIVQQAMLSAWSALGRQTEVQELRSWLHRIVHNAALRVAAHDDEHDVLREALAGHRLTDTAVEHRLEAREALAAVAALPERQRRAFVMTALGGASGSHAAAALGVSEGTVRQLVHRARTALRSASGALIPGPLVTWAATSGSGDSVAGRVAELGAGAGVAATVGKVCAAVAVTASIVGGTTQILHHDGAGQPARAHLGARARGHRRESPELATRIAPAAVTVAVAEPTTPRSRPTEIATLPTPVPVVARRQSPATAPWSRSTVGRSSPGSQRSGATGRGGGPPGGGDRSASGSDGSARRGDGSSGGGDGTGSSSTSGGGTSSSGSDNPAVSTVTPGSPTGETASVDDNQPAAAAPAPPGTTTAVPAPQPADN